MDIRILNSKGDMIAVGDRTIKTSGNAVVLLDRDNHLEQIEWLADNNAAESIKKLIINSIEKGIQKEKQVILIKLV